MSRRRGRDPTWSHAELDNSVIDPLTGSASDAPGMVHRYACCDRRIEPGGDRPTDRRRNKA
jgi:hypothetical protein